MDYFQDLYEMPSASFAAAESLTNSYLDSLFEFDYSKPIRHSLDGLEWGDLNSNLAVLKNQLILLEKTGYKDLIPCLAAGKTYVPINIMQYLNDPDKLQSIFDDNDFDLYFRWVSPAQRFGAVIDKIKSNTNRHFAAVWMDDLREIMRVNLSGFIAIRHATLSQGYTRDKVAGFFRNGPPGGSPPGSTASSVKYLTVQLNTVNHGLQIQASPAYFVNWSYFGSPTSPITGSLIPGKYIFAGSGVGLPTFTVDPTIVDIPPNFNITLNGI